MGYSREEAVDKARSYRRKSKKSRKKEKRKEEEKKYDKRRGDKDSSPDNFEEFLDDYNLRTKGAGSDKKPKASRLSALDLREMFREGRDKYGLSKADSARGVIDYFDDMKDRTRHGGATASQLAKYRAMLKEEEEGVTTRPTEDRPDPVKEAQQEFEDTRLDKPENLTPRLEDAYQDSPGKYDGDANMGAIRGGDDLNEWYATKFVPHLEADANATFHEIGDDSRYFLSKFLFEPPKLGSVKDVFDKYKDEIEDLD